MSHDGYFEQQLARAKHPALIEEEPTIVVETTQGDEDENPALPEPPVKHASSTLGDLFRRSDAHPIALDLALINRWKIEWFGWELETLLQRITQEFQTPTIADVNIEKLQAVRTLHLVDDFWGRWEVFNPCVAALNGSFADFQRMQVPSVPECLVAVDIAARIRDDLKYSAEVQAFLAVVHQHDGMLVPQAPLDFVHVATSDFHGDYNQVRTRWPEVRLQNKAPTGGTIEDEQLRRMLAARKYLELTRTQLKDQLALFPNA